MTQDEALLIMQSGKNCFLTGKAGTGKSYLTNIFKNEMNFKGKRVIVVAPTGIAAINVGGATIHSTFKMFGQYPDLNISCPTQQVEWKHIDCLIIDEISMVSPDFLDMIDMILKYERRSYEPFGGIQVILVGDPKQLPPVIASYTDSEKKIKKELHEKYGKSLTFNKAESFAGFEILILSEVKRQNDDYFISLLNSIREGDKTVLRKFQRGNGDEDTIHLFHTNKEADAMNSLKLDALEGEMKEYEGEVNGDFNIKNAITPVDLYLKIGARIMITKNGNGLVNGDTGYVIGLSDEFATVTIDRFGTTHFEVPAATWEQSEYKGTERYVIGTFTQIPIKLAYAISIHKSQGLSLDNVSIGIKQYMDISMIYTALSRATNFNKLYIK